MSVVEGRHPQAATGRVVAWRADCEVRERTIHFKARFDGGLPPHEGQFDFDPSKLDPEAALSAYLQDHIARAPRDAAP